MARANMPPWHWPPSTATPTSCACSSMRGRIRTVTTRTGSMDIRRRSIRPCGRTTPRSCGCSWNEARAWTSRTRSTTAPRSAGRSTADGPRSRPTFAIATCRRDPTIKRGTRSACGSGRRPLGRRWRLPDQADTENEHSNGKNQSPEIGENDQAVGSSRSGTKDGEEETCGHEEGRYGDEGANEPLESCREASLVHIAEGEEREDEQHPRMGVPGAKQILA